MSLPNKHKDRRPAGLLLLVNGKERERGEKRQRETEREEEGRHGNALFDPPSLALGELPMLTAALRDGQIVPPALAELVCSCVCACVPWKKDSKDISSL